MRPRSRLRLLMAVATLASALALPPAASAADGEVIQLGTNISGEVYINNGRPRFHFGNVGNCPGTPPPGASCYVELQFIHRCAEPWCFSDEVSGWFRVPAGQDWFQAPICADGGNHWKVNSRLHWTFPSIHTIEMWGQTEWNAVAGTYGLIAKAIFDVSLQVGLRISGGTRMNVITASNAVSSYGRIAESFGYPQGPPSC